MLEHIIVEHCAPTLAGIKTGNIFTVRGEKSTIMDEIRKLNGMLTKKGLRLVPLRRAKGGTMVYLYRPKCLKRDLERPEAREILSGRGYSCESPACCLAQLARNLLGDGEFPHEIGLFLGYPPADVKGFIKSPSEGVKCAGCWKAYGNECEAEETFNRYRRCTAVYCREKKKGKPLEALVVDEGRDHRLSS